MHPISRLQAALVTALRDDAALVDLIGDGVFDAPPAGRVPPYVVVQRHDVRSRDVDLGPGHEHRLQLACWSDQPSRKTTLEIVERVLAVALSLAADAITVTHREHLRTETAIDDATGRARATVTLKFFTEG